MNGLNGLNGFEGFGIRIQTLRKRKNITQGELADRMGVSAQAVSKWETGAGYPDIVSLPALAAILETDLDGLFGIAQAEETPEFPAQVEGYALVHSFGDVACYSDKAVASTDGSGVRFADGSTAELSNRLIVNKGVGEIRLFTPDAATSARGNAGKKALALEFGATDALNVTILNNDCEIAQSADGKTRVTASGSAAFIDILKVGVEGGTLTVRFEEHKELQNEHDNKIFVEVPYCAGARLDAVVNGHGNFKCPLRFEQGSFTVNGAGDAVLADFGEMRMTINGAGDAELGKVENMVLSINGAGDVKIVEAGNLNVTINGAGDLLCETVGSVRAGINGSGDIKFGKGEADKFDVDIHGAGDVDAKGVTARVASIMIAGGGHVTLGRVTESSTEQVKKSGRIHILARGKA